MPPLVSIISVVFRAAPELPRLLDSIVAHRTEDTEFIVIDGGSDDGTVEILRSYGDAIDYWVSEPDRGIYDAMNKGIAAATGEFVLHLNAGDWLLQIPRNELKKCKADGVDLACFAVDAESFGGVHRPRLGLRLWRIAHVWHHQGSFYRRTTHMGYDTRFPVHADFDLNQRMMIARKQVRAFKIVVAGHDASGISSTQCTLKEQCMLVRRNFGVSHALLAFAWFRLSLLIPPIKRLGGYLRSLGKRERGREGQ